MPAELLSFVPPARGLTLAQLFPGPGPTRDLPLRGQTSKTTLGILARNRSEE